MEDFMEDFKELGEKLRKEREKKRISLDTLSQETKIKTEYLKAIEEGEFSRLPTGEVYREGFVKSYAKAIGLNTDGILKRYKEIKGNMENKERVEEKQEQKQTYDYEGSSRFSRVSYKPVIIIILLMFSFFVVKQILLSPTEESGQLKTDANNNQTESIGLELQQGANNKENIQKGNSMAPEVSIPDEREDVVTLIKDDKLETKYMVKAPQIALELRVISSRCWIKVIVDGEDFYEGTLIEGESKAVSGKSKIWIRIGNPLVVDITVNGKHLGVPEGNTRNFVFIKQQ